MKFNGLDRYCLYNLSLNLIDLRIFSVIHDLILYLCLLNLIVFLEEMFPLHLLYVFRLCHRYHLGFHVNRCLDGYEEK